ncbi:MAG TPA: DUF3540 domain-containing protein [Chitinolyticbacter sp.]|nr:DUF3540 domain-containing protein [Chitinolyticbacter sp.]
MMQIHDRSTTTVIPALADALLVVALDDGRFLLDDGRIACQAASCLLTPQSGDRALVAACAGGECFVVHLLTRSGDEAVLSVPGVRQLAINQPAIALNAAETITLRALGDMSLASATGTLTLNARNLFTTVTDTLVEQTRHYVGRAEQYLLDARQLLRLHGKQALMTAEKDVKVDADRISMG